MPEETAEQKAAREEQEAKDKADAEAAAKKAEEDEAAKIISKPGDKKDLGEDLAGKDVSKFSSKEMLDYIDNLKDENAKRRIANRDLKIAQTKAEKKLSEVEAKLTDAAKRLEQVESEKKATADAEKSEVERLQGEVKDFKDKLSAMETRIKDSDKAIFEKDLLIKKQSRETEVNALLNAANVKFSSDYERQGFMAGLMKTDSDGDFVTNDEAVHYEVGQFIKKSKEKQPPAQPPDTPPSGPPGRSGEADIHARIKALTSKANSGRLTSDDQKELDELLDLAGQAAAYDPRLQDG